MSEIPFAVASFFFGDRYAHLPKVGGLRESATLVQRALLSVRGLPGGVRFSDSEACLSPQPIGSTEELRTQLTDLANRADWYGPEVLLCYIVGHGYEAHGGMPHVCSRDSKISTAGSGLSLAEILGTLGGGRPRHLILVLDMCRAPGGPAWAKLEEMGDGLWSNVERYKSIIVIFSATERADAYGGLIREHPETPLSAALAGFLQDDEQRQTARGDVEAVIRCRMDALYSQLRLKHGQAEVVVRGGEDELSLLRSPGRRSSTVSQRPPGRVDVSALKRIVREREEKSLREDRYLGGAEFHEPWTMTAALDDHPELACVPSDYIFDNDNPAIVVGESGSGKTTLAKWTSLRISRDSDANRVALYLNASRLEQDHCGSGVAILSRYLSDWRYGVRAFESEGEVRRLISQSRVCLFIDAVDEVWAQGSLALRRLTALKETTVVVFCQTYDLDRVRSLVRGPTTRELSLQRLPLTIVNAGDNLPTWLPDHLTPRQLQELTHYASTHGNRLPKTHSQIMRFQLEFLHDSFESEVSKSRRLALARHLSRGSEKPGSPFLAVCWLAEELRRRSVFQEASEDVAHQAAQAILSEYGAGGPKEAAAQLLDIALRGGILRQDDGPGTPIRFVHRRDQELLIAAAWEARSLSDDELVQHARDHRWELAIATFGLLVAPRRLPLDRLATANPFSAARCIREGVICDKTEVVAVGEALLSKRSYWTRSHARRALGMLSEEVSAWLCDQYELTSDVGEQVTIALALGETESSTAREFLRARYLDALAGIDDRSSYLRRRILDALGGHVELSWILNCLVRITEVDPREWVRVLRSANVRTRDDLGSLHDSTGVVCGSRPWPHAIEACLLVHKTHVEGETDGVINAHLNVELAKAIVSPDKWQRCISALLIDDENVTALEGCLTAAFRAELDPHAKGDMAYALGQVGEQNGGLQVVLDFYAHAKASSFPQLHCEELEDLLNDVRLGLARAAARGGVRETDIPPTTPLERRQRLLNEMERFSTKA